MALNDSNVRLQEAGDEAAGMVGGQASSGEPSAQAQGTRHSRSPSYARRTHRHHRRHSRRNDSWESEYSSGGESGSTSCSTCSAGKHSERRRRGSSRRVSVQHAPVSRRSTRRVMIDESSDSAELEGLQGSDEELEEDDTVRARQEAMNARHPFGLPIWKPALYKKSRSVTRAAFLALHARPLRSETLYLKPGNIMWMLLAGWWLMAVCLAVSAVLYVVPWGGRYYARVTAGLGWYLFWPFGRYVERIKDNVHARDRCSLSDTEHEEAPLLGQASEGVSAEVRHKQFRRHSVLGRAVFYVLLVLVVNPLLIVVSALSWFAVFSIPMGKLTHTLSRYLWRDPLALHFRSGDLPTVQVAQEGEGAPEEQPAPTVLLCTNEAVGWYYYKYTVDGVNILFYNMLSVAVFVLFAAFVLAPMTHHQHALVQPGVLFPMCLVSTVPLAYFIGQA
ncbi:hypothetical protein EC988_006188, partial [Linderina pennispora]